MSVLPPIERPNGKLYKPLKVIAHSWDNDAVGDGYGCGVVVLGTHDVERAHQLAVDACTYWYGMRFAINPEVGWFRLGYRLPGEYSWLRDPVRGRAGVMFTASDDPEEVSDGG